MRLSEIEAWQTALSLPDTVGEECAQTEVFETSLFNIGAAVTSVRWHFSSTIKIQRWPCCFDNQLSMHNIPPVCATWISPRPGFSSALILEKRGTFHATPKKERNALCADKGVKREGVGGWGVGRQIRADIYLHYLERSSNRFHFSLCELWSRQHNDRMPVLWLNGQNIFFVWLVGPQEIIHTIAQGEGNTFHSSYCSHQV